MLGDGAITVPLGVLLADPTLGLTQVAGPATERRSGETAENKDEGMAFLVRASRDGLRAVERWEGEVRRRAADFRGRASHQSLGLFPILRPLLDWTAIHLRYETRRRISGPTTACQRKQN